MRLLREYTYRTEAESAANTLRTKGILAFISSTNSNHLSRHQTGAIKVGLWSVIDNQHEDAIKIINGQRCIISNPLTEKDMKKLEKDSADRFSGSINSLLNKFSIVFLFIVISAALYAILIN